MKRIVAIVQARMGSTRLPGKSMLTLAGRPIVEHVLRRVQRAQSLTQVVMATSEQSKDDILCGVADRLGALVFRGNEYDVLKRYAEAAQAFGADVVVRVCADNPLVAPEEIDRIIMHHLNTGADYSFNHRPTLGNHYPDGLGAEVIMRGVLQTIDRQAVDHAHREHVTTYIWDHLRDFHVETVQAPADIAGADIKLDVDTDADFRLLQTLVNALPRDDSGSWSAQQIVATYRSCIASNRANPSARGRCEP